MGRFSSFASVISKTTFSLIFMLLSGDLFAVTYQTVLTPWIRLEEGPHGLRVDPNSKYMAFTNDQGFGLQVLEMQTKKVFQVTREYVGTSFFWAPDGFRLFYREQHRSAGTKSKSGEKTALVTSKLAAFDTKLGKSLILDTLNGPTGLLTFDPRDLRMYLMQETSILTKRLTFPNERLARWQIAQRTDSGRWVATQNGMLWITQSGVSMRRLEDDGSPIESFSLSPDGTTAAWATTLGNIWISRSGDQPKKLDRGRDPAWHPDKPFLLYSGARMVGNKVINHNIKISDLKGSARFLTYTQHSSERWPQWYENGTRVAYTHEKSTDIFTMDFVQ